MQCFKHLKYRKRQIVILKSLFIDETSMVSAVPLCRVLFADASIW